MKITVSQENLNRALSYLHKAIPSKPQLPILSSVLFSIEDGVATMAATDLYLGIRAQVQVEADSDGQIVIPGKQFADIVRSLNPGEVVLTYEDGTMTIDAGGTTATLQCHVSDEYPQFPDVSGGEFDLSAAVVDEIQQLVTFSASTDQARPVLTAVQFQFSQEQIEVVATDGFRLSLLQVENESGMEQGSVLIPAKAMGEAYRIMKQIDHEILTLQVSEEMKQVYIKLGDVEMYVRLIEGQYPPYEQIVPTLFGTEVTFDREELEDHIKRAMIFARETSNIVRFMIDDGKATIVASSTSLGTYTGELEQVQVEGDAGEIAFNARYLIDYLGAVGGDEVWFGMKESLKPALFKSGAAANHRYVVMPFKVNA